MHYSEEMYHVYFLQLGRYGDYETFSYGIA